MKRRTLYFLITLFLILVTGSFFAYQYFLGNHSLSEDDKVVEALSERIVVPAGIPTVATVTDTTKFKQHPFLGRAAVGDKIILYTDAGQGFLFRPSTNKIIDITTLITNGSAEPVELRLPEPQY